MIWKAFFENKGIIVIPAITHEEVLQNKVDIRHSKKHRDAKHA